MVSEGTFQLYPRYDPPLKAGLYRFTTEQLITASGPDHTTSAADTPDVAPLQTHVRVRSPQYLLPPDQVLSTFPPANHEGDFGARLPQVVIKRRTLPWERAVDDDAKHEQLPWLALVLIAEGEAELRTNKPVAECVTAGVTLDPPADVAVGNYLAIRASAVRRFFPTQDEVGLLAHVRAVDISDTELMMGDDDGFLAVVISNRLPLPGTDKDGNPVPVKYVACLVNLCGQLDALQSTEPTEATVSSFPVVLATQALTLVDVDRSTMRSGFSTAARSVVLSDASDEKAISAEDTQVAGYYLNPGTTAPYTGSTSWAGSQAAQGTVSNVYDAMAASFSYANTVGFVGGTVALELDPELHFPVLLYWSFTTTGNDTFESLMQGLSSGLLGTVPDDTAPAGRPPFEVTETGHVGLDHRLRVGDQVRSWYRGPFVPHPTEDPPGGRLAIAHSSDQLRIVVPDGREDLSLAAAFEIGRLLGLSRPSIVASLMRWRQAGFTAAWLSSTYAGRGLLDRLGTLELTPDRLVGGKLGAFIAQQIAAEPAGVLGNPAPLATPGRPVITDAAKANELLATAIGLVPDGLSGKFDAVLTTLRSATPLRTPILDEVPPTQVRAGLGGLLDDTFSRTVVRALAPQLRDGTVTIDADQLPGDLRVDLASALVPNLGELRRRLDLHLSVAALPKDADQLDLLMHAASVRDGGEDAEEDR